MVMIRAQKGVSVPLGELGLALHAADEPIFALIYLASPEHDPAQHLRILAQVARCAEDPCFMGAWLAAKSKLDLRVLLLREERMLQIELAEEGPLRTWIGRSPREVGIPAGVLIALVRRGEDVLIPGAATVLRAGDCLTLIGEPSGLAQLGIRRSLLPPSPARA
jgi:NhaP-type Na+/H+ and K+/H+ antiporter